MLLPRQGGEYYLEPYSWSFQNYCYLDFSQGANFTATPHQGSSYDRSLVGYWNMDESVGSTAHDGSGNSNDGTLYGCTWVSGKYANAVKFDGTSNYIGIADNPILHYDEWGRLTISLWFNPYVAQNSSRIIHLGYPSIGIDFQGHLFFELHWADGSFNNIIYDGNLPSNSWYLVTGIYDRSVQKMYVNNVLVGSYTKAGALAFYLNGDQNVIHIGSKYGNEEFL